MQNKRRIAIVGSRNFINIEKVYGYLKDLSKDIIIISGGVRGVDCAAITACKILDLECEEFLPNIEKYGSPKAFHIRNQEIVDSADELIAFWNGRSKGTLSTLRKAAKKKIPVTIIGENSDGNSD